MQEELLGTREGVFRPIFFVNNFYWVGINPLDIILQVTANSSYPTSHSVCKRSVEVTPKLWRFVLYLIIQTYGVLRATNNKSSLYLHGLANTNKQRVGSGYTGDLWS